MRASPAKVMQATYERAGDLFKETYHPRTCWRLREAAQLVLAARSTHADHFPQSKIGEDMGSISRNSEHESLTLLWQEAWRLASSARPILITGGEDSSRQLLARLIHERSGRTGLFVAVNCARLTQLPSASELFGQGQGGLNKGVGDGTGHALRAAEGTLFLDEVQELSRSHQQALLRLIKHGVIASHKRAPPQRVDVRVIAATSCDMREEVERELFSPELYQYLRSSRLVCDSLGERILEARLLAGCFIKEAIERCRGNLKHATEVVDAVCRIPAAEAADSLLLLVERSLATAPKPSAHKKERSAQDKREAALTPDETEGDGEQEWAECSLDEELERYEAKLVGAALQAAGGRVAEAAQLLGIKRQRLASMLEKRHRELLVLRGPIKRRKRSIVKGGSLSTGQEPSKCQAVCNVRA